MEVYFNLSIWEDTYKALFDHKYINFKIIKAPTAIRAPRLSTGTDVHNDTFANPHEIKVFGSRRIYFTEKI